MCSHQERKSGPYKSGLSRFVLLFSFSYVGLKLSLVRLLWASLLCAVSGRRGGFRISHDCDE